MKTLSLSLTLLLFLPMTVLAKWTLVNNESSIHFISVKKNTLAEVHTFTQLTGNVDNTGALSIDIDLSSVETNIPIRNQRMKEMLFDVIKFPTANVSGKIDLVRLNEIPVGGSIQYSVELALSIHGFSQKLSTPLKVTKLMDGQLLVNLVKPIILNTDAYGLTEGVNQLREVAKLPSISTAVPITASLVFKYRN